MSANHISPATVPLRASVSMPWESDPPKRILVTDNEPLIRQLYTEALVASGYQVDAAEDSVTAWDALQKRHYDLLITDYEMPNGSGIDLLKMLHATQMTLSVIMATASFPKDEFIRNPWLQPAVTLLKPYTLTEFLTTVKQVMYSNHYAHVTAVPPPIWQVRCSTVDRPRVS